MTVHKLFFIYILLALSSAVRAHQQQEALTKIVVQPKTAAIDITHRLYIHDAEQALKAIAPKNYDLISSETAQKTFVKYVLQQFSLELNDAASELSLLGYELEGKYLWVYQTARLNQAHLSATSLKLSIDNRMLTTYFPQQKNRVNIEYAGEVSAFVLDRHNFSFDKQLTPVPK
ncbi:MAG: hypothetical protein KTR17_01985 [Cellvibrionaceae bacterium]|nr:hypothetical protein [Cellvibrionaceae bacterium]